MKDLSPEVQGASCSTCLCINEQVILIFIYGFNITLTFKRLVLEKTHIYTLV